MFNRFRYFFYSSIRLSLCSVIFQQFEYSKSTTQKLEIISYLLHSCWSFGLCCTAKPWIRIIDNGRCQLIIELNRFKTFWKYFTFLHRKYLVTNGKVLGLAEGRNLRNECRNVYLTRILHFILDVILALTKWCCVMQCNLLRGIISSYSNQIQTSSFHHNAPTVYYAIIPQHPSVLSFLCQTGKFIFISYRYLCLTQYHRNKRYQNAWGLWFC